MLLATRAKQIGPVRTAPWLIYLRSSKVVLAGLVSERRLALPTRANEGAARPDRPFVCLAASFGKRGLRSPYHPCPGRHRPERAEFSPAYRR